MKIELITFVVLSSALSLNPYSTGMKIERAFSPIPVEKMNS